MTTKAKAKAKAKELNTIEWENHETGLKLFGTVRKVLENSVIVDIIGLDYSTVVSHKRYRIIQEAEVDGTAAEKFRNSHSRLVHRKWF